MAARRHSLEELQAAVDLVSQYTSVNEAARANGIPPETLRTRIKTAAARGLMGYRPILPGFELSKSTTVRDRDGNVVREFLQQKPEHGEIFAVPEGHKIKGVSALVDGDGRIAAQWIKTKEGELDPQYICDLIQKSFDNIERAFEPVSPPQNCDEDLLTLLPLADLHMGLRAWAGEVKTNWDLKIAFKTYKETIRQVSACSPSSAHAIVLGGGDFIHANTNEYRTRSGNVLDGDGRIDLVIDTSVQLAVFQIDIALLKHLHVTVRILKGNHDDYSSIALYCALKAWYRNDPRVTVDADPSLFWWYSFGDVFLGATHGHAAKVNDMPLIMANRKPKEWGNSKFRFIHMFHVHHKTQRIFEHGGVIAESHQSPVEQDSYHFGEGYLSGRSMQAITYHKTRGEIIRNNVSL